MAKEDFLTEFAVAAADFQFARYAPAEQVALKLQRLSEFDGPEAVAVLKAALDVGKVLQRAVVSSREPLSVIYTREVVQILPLHSLADEHEPQIRQRLVECWARGKELMQDLNSTAAKPAKKKPVPHTLSAEPDLDCEQAWYYHDREVAPYFSR